MDILLLIKKLSETINIDENNFALIPNHCRYIMETQAVFLFPKSNTPLDSLKNQILEINKYQRSKGENNLINENKLNVLFGVVNKGSHATIEIVHDHEHYTPEHFKQMCINTIKIIENIVPHQLG